MKCPNCGGAALLVKQNQLVCWNYPIGPCKYRGVFDEGLIRVLWYSLAVICFTALVQKPTPQERVDTGVPCAKCHQGTLLSVEQDHWYAYYECSDCGAHADLERNTLGMLSNWQQFIRYDEQEA